MHRVRPLRMATAVVTFVAVLALADVAAAQDATPATSVAEAAGVLVIQAFAAARLEPVAGEAGRATLTLEEPFGDAVYFSDRPNRTAGTVSTAELLQALNAAADDPLNGALVAKPSGDDEVVVVVELLRGEADASGVVTYEVQLLAGYDDIDLVFDAVPLTELAEPLQFAAGHLFIDKVGFCSSYPCGAG